MAPRPLRIGVDVSCREVARTGVRTYLEALLPALTAAGPCEVVELAPPLHEDPRSAAAKVARHARHQHWMQVGLPRALARERCDVLLGPEYEVPLRAPCPRVAVFHDAGFWLNPGQYNPLWRGLINRLAVPAARSAARVITVSESAKADLIRLLHFPPDHVAVVPEAAKSLGNPTPEQAAAVLSRYRLSANGYFLHVGVLERRKNLVRLVEAFARVAEDSDVRLVLAGQPGPKRAMDDTQGVLEAVRRCGLEDRVVLTGFVPDMELAVLYGGALAVVLPSLMEGFGLPVLEAFQYGSPLLCARATALPEVAGDAALYFAPEDVGAMAARMREVAADGALRARLAAAGRERGRQFSWEIAAAGTLAVLRKAAGR